MEHRTEKLNSLLLDFNLNILPLSANHYSPNTIPYFIHLIAFDASYAVEFGHLTTPIGTMTFCYFNIECILLNLRVN